MSDARPNLLLLMTDQHRGDCIGIDGHPCVQTPYIDELAGTGARFTRAYSSCPVCVPARRTLMTGRTAAHHGVTQNYSTRLDGPTLPGELSKAGYHTHLCGKLHLWPHRKRYGFDSAAWADSPTPGTDDDYQRFLTRAGITFPRASQAHGMHTNGWAVRPWHLEERYHFTNWVTDEALDFLERRDPTAPFFLKVSYLHPHEPLTPPRDYYDRYMAMDLPEPHVGEWARVFDGPQRGLKVDSWRTALEPQVMKQFRAAYYASINHVDDQIGRILAVLPENTMVLFVSDHGEMLGDHQWIRKRSAYEPSARIPWVMRFPKSMGIKPGQVSGKLVELMDVMPTFLDAAGLPIPESVDGKSVLPLLRGQNDGWRKELHGECADLPSTNSGVQFIVEERWKYVYFPGTGAEQIFDLQEDPQEMKDLAKVSKWAKELKRLRARLVEILKDRPEGFSDGKVLKVLGGPSPKCLPGFEKDAQ